MLENPRRRSIAEIHIDAEFERERGRRVDRSLNSGYSIQVIFNAMEAKVLFFRRFKEKYYLSARQRRGSWSLLRRDSRVLKHPILTA